MIVTVHYIPSYIKSIWVEFDLHKDSCHNFVIRFITLLKFKVSLIPCLKRFYIYLYIYAVELVSSNQFKISIFHVEVPKHTCPPHKA